MLYLAFLFAILIGVSLGLIGTGGGILCVPVLVYLIGIEPTEATTYSLFIVGTTAVVGSLKNLKNGLIDFHTAAFFGLPSVAAMALTRRLLMPVLPDVLFRIGDIIITKNTTIMVVFAVVMLTASLSMIRTQTIITNNENAPNRLELAIKGVLIGVLGGFVGVGGGFLIVPTLLFAGKLPMKQAVATSLILIACNSLIGFVGSVPPRPIDWQLVLCFTLFAVGGIFIGSLLSYRISNERLKPAFGWFVLAIGVYVMVKELL